MVVGAESWIVNPKTESRITAQQMKCLRKIAGHTRRDRIRNNVIREELGVTPIIETVEIKALKWLGHVTRMKEERLPKRVMEARPNGGRGRGRPRMEWEEYMGKITSKRGKTLKETKKMAIDRDGYKKWIDPTLKGRRG